MTDGRTTTQATSPTQPENAASLRSEIATEQGVVDTLYRRLDALRATTRERLAETRRTRSGGIPQHQSERDSFATLYEDRIAQLESVEDRLAFGRLDLAEGGERYIGRLGLTDAEHTQLLTDWRAPAAQAFYRATAARPDGVTRRRHLITRGREVTGVEDEVLDLDLLAEAQEGSLGHLSGEGALLAALAAGRTGKMHDIVATIQAEQDVVVRSELAGALVVQGGPGTGKTAVALHRAAYLLYAHRRSLERSGVLLIGPSLDFLHYIDQVLPSLGETGVLSATMADLFPGVHASATEPDEVARLKGLPLWKGVIERAVRERQRVPRAAKAISVDGREVVITPQDVSEAIAKARRGGRPHNLARASFVRDMLGRLAAQYAEQLAFPIPPDERAEIIEELRTTREVRIALNLAWMPLTAQSLIESLFARTERLAAAAPRMHPSERALLYREAGSAWTPADVPLLDEAAELLGEDDQAARAQARLEADRRSADVDFARSVLDSSGAGAMVSAEMLAERFAGSGSRLTTAERAAADRTWTYGHIVVDEAQELSAMDWRMLLRRVPTRSLTIVGDTAQTSSPRGARTWESRLDPVLRGSWRKEVLTVNYRTPATVADAAGRVARAAGLVTSPLTSARDVPDALVLVPTEELDATVRDQTTTALGEVSAGTDGRVAVICAATRVPELRAQLADLVSLRVDGQREAPVSVVSARESKGLEYDVVVLVEPAEILAESAGNLYVAMTRPTRRLRVVHAVDLPAGVL